MATHFGLQSQTTRLSEEASCATVGRSRAWGYHPLHCAISRRLQEDRCSDGPSPDYNSPTHCFKITGLGCSCFTRHYWGNPHYQAGAQGATGAWHIDSSSIACTGQAGRLEIGDLKGQKARWPFKSPLSNAKKDKGPRPSAKTRPWHAR